MPTTTNMSLILPTPGPGGTLGPTWASDLNTAFGVIDEHDHSSGKGVRITPTGLHINQELNFSSQNAAMLRSVKFDSQAAALALGGDIRSLYSVLGDLYFNNASGTPIQITSGSGLNFASVGTIGGDFGQPGVTAAVTYSNTTKVFSFTQASGITAGMAFGTLQLFENAASANPITIQSPASLASAYSLTLFAALPGDYGVVLSGATGVLATEEVAAGNEGQPLVSQGAAAPPAFGEVETAGIADGAVSSDKIADGAVSSDKIANNAVGSDQFDASSITGTQVRTMLATSMGSNIPAHLATTPTLTGSYATYASKILTIAGTYLVFATAKFNSLGSVTSVFSEIKLRNTTTSTDVTPEFEFGTAVSTGTLGYINTITLVELVTVESGTQTIALQARSTSGSMTIQNRSINILRLY